jgi:hypothetical protein
MIDLRKGGPVSASARSNENEELPAPDFPARHLPIDRDFRVVVNALPWCPI